ncbi:RING finger protein 17 [Nasonia vitripennis]|uniref:RING finger protein 17 n=1 Tax=Nasonia vitripennis TaxID=7425 RepID=A0A7M7PXG7_NASVI|nr:RING finger protein 17 [Nasonia vitripennis]
MLCRYNRREALANGGGGYSQGTTSYGHYNNGYYNQSYQSYNGYEKSGTPPPRNSSPIINYPATYPQLRTKDIVCGFCKHRFYIGKDLKAAYSPLLLPCGHATCSTCESSKPGRACPQCPDFPVDIEARKRLPCNLYVIGLVHAIVSTPMHIDDPDMNFHVPLNAIARQNFEQGSCSECGMTAYYDCKQCEVRYCKLCFKKMHRKALQSHKPIPLNKSAFDFTISTFCPNHESEATEYYCNQCDFEGCSHCIIKFHRDHDTEPHIERNKEWLTQFRAAFAKLQDTRMRIHQTQQTLTSKVVCPEVTKQTQAVENQITRHFVHLHGVLQNLEQEMRDKLREQRMSLQRDVEEFRSTLATEGEKLNSACALAARAEANCGRVNLQKLTEKLLELADTPCHVLPTEEYKEEIKIEVDSSVFNSIRQHIQLQIPDVPRFHLVKTYDLPEDYELEPLPQANETIITESSFRLSSQRDVSSPALSIQSRSSSPSLNESKTPEPSSLEKGCKEHVEMTNLVDPTEFYVQRRSTRRILEELEADIVKFIESDPPKPEVILLNSLYVVHDRSNNKWIRGRVISVQDGSPTTYEVLYIDYGYKESGLTLDSIKCAKPQFNIEPGLAVRCSLAEIAPIEGNEWDDEVIHRFSDMAKNSELTIHVLNVDETVHIVELIGFGNNNGMTVSFRDWLIDVKLAKPTTFYKLKRMNPLSAHQFYQDELPLNKYTKVEISFIESPNSIYVKKVHQEKYYQDIMHQFNHQYSKLQQKEDLTIKLPEYGDKVTLKENKVWRRGIITNIRHKESKVEVFLVDIGSTQLVPYDQLKRLPNRFCNWSAQVMKVSLLDIKPIDGVEWNLEVTNFLKTNLEGRQVTVIPFLKTEKTFNVCMYVDRDININALLVSKSFAQSTGLRSKREVLDKDIGIPQKNRKKDKKNAKAVKGIATSASSKPKKETVQRVEESDPYKVRVSINKIISPDIIYVSDCSNRESYNTMTAEMQKFYKSKKGRVQGPLDSNWVYCVYSRKDKQFCRAQLLDTSESGPSIVKMTLVDLAEVEDIPLDEIQPLEPRFIDTPKYQFKVRLAGIEPCGGSKDWQSSSCQKLKDIIHDTGDFKYYITLIEDSGPKDPMPVELFITRKVFVGPINPERKETFSVARCLIDHGLALPIRGFNMKNEELKELAIELKKKLQFGNSHYDNTRQLSDISNTIIEEEPILDNDSNSNSTTGLQNVEDVEKEEIVDVSGESTPLPPKVVDWIEPAHIQETIFHANITYVDWDGNVYFHPDTNEYKDTLQYISDTLFKHYNNRSIKKYDYKWEVGDLCIASFHADKKWYRGRVTQVVSQQIVMVLFVDYGNIEECSVGSLKKRIILEHIPIQCTKARIVGINPINRKWKESDLDIIHAATVSQPCRIKIVTRPPNPWKVAVWVKPSDYSTFFPLPWYLKNKTTVSNIEIDNSILYCQDDENFQKENYKPIQSVKTNEKIIISINSEDSSESSIDEEDSELAMSNSGSSVESVVVFGEIPDNCSLNMPKNSELSPEITMRMNHFNRSTSVNNSRSCSPTVDSRNDSFSEEIDEKVLSGNSIYLKINGNSNIDFETESVKSEALMYDSKNGHMVASTPLNTTYQDIDTEFIFGPIDFSMYEITTMEISVSTMFSDKSFSGYILQTTNEELNQWIKKASELHEQINKFAEKQPILEIELEKNCIVKYKDEMWYRAHIVKKVDNESGHGVCVELVDFGNRFYVFDELSLRTTKDEWLQIPMMGIRFRLSDIKFDETKELKDLHRAVMKVIGRNHKFTAVIKNHGPILDLELYWDKGCKESIFTQMFKSGALEILNMSVD